MKKLFKWIFILLLTAAILTGGAVTALYFMYPPAKLKEMGQQYFKTHFNREITFDSLGLAVVGVTLKGFALSEEGGFQNGTFVSASKATAKVRLKPLFDKQVQIKTIGLDDLTVNIIKDKNGRFNFDDLIENALKLAGEDKPQAQQVPTAAAPMALAIVADTIYIKNATVNFSDKAAGMDFAIRKFNFSISRFDINNPFGFEGSFVTDLKLPDIKLSPVNFAYAGRANLAGLVMKDASLELTNFEAAYKSFKAAVSGKVSNFDNPAADLKGTITGVDNRLAQEFVEEKLPQFSLPAINLTLNTITNIEGNTTRINEGKISIGKSFINTTADIDYSKPDLIYKAAVKMAVNLKEIADIAKESLADFKLTGDISGDISAVSANALPSVKGHIDFKNIGAVAMEKELKNLSGVITINSLDDIKSNLIKGVFDSSDFSTSFAYAKPAKVMNIDFFFDMDTFTLDDIDFDALIPQNQTKEEKAAAKAAQEAAKKNPPQHQPIVDQSAPRGDPLNIKADITIRKIANNIFDTNDLKFKVDIKDLDNRLDKATGSINFSTQDGEIRDLEKLMNQSKFIKIALTSVRVIQKAFSVLDILNPGSSFSANSVKYSLIEGAYTLKDGAVNIAKTDLNSDLATVKTTGTVNLLTEKLDMKIEAHIGKQGASGFKPVIIKVGGTIADPSFKPDVVGTLTSVLSVPGNTVKDAADAGAGAVKGMVDGVGGALKGIAGALKK